MTCHSRLLFHTASYMANFGSAAVDIVGKKYIQQGVGLMSVAFGIAQFTTFLVTGKVFLFF